MSFAKRLPLWRLSVATAPEAEEAVGDLLGQLFGQRPSTYTDAKTGACTVTVYCARRSNLAAAKLGQLRAGLKRIRSCGLEIRPARVSVRRLQHEDWAESWKKHFRPLEIGPALLVKPGWSGRHPRRGQAVVMLDPGLSFGTGQHPTTAFCLQQIVRYRKPGVHVDSATKHLRDAGFGVPPSGGPTRARRANRLKAELQTVATRAGTRQSFLDIGTGSGILAIAAAKLGYAPVDAFDFDREAVRVAKANARKNGVARKLSVTCRDLAKLPLRNRRRYDLVCANLIATLLLGERARIVGRIAPEGTLVLAGILKTEFAAVQRAYERAGLRLIARRAGKEWRSGAFVFNHQRRGCFPGG